MSIEVSSVLIYQTLTMVENCLEEAAKDKQPFSQDGNSPSFHIFPIYFCAASVEVFMNEVFLSAESRTYLPNAALWNRKNLEYLETIEKVCLIPTELFGKPFSKNSRVYQHMRTLIQVRNFLIHHKDADKNDPPKFLRPMMEKGIFLKDTKQYSLSPIIKLSSTKGAIWAYDTACNTVLTLLSLATDQYRDSKYFEYFHLFDANKSR